MKQTLIYVKQKNKMYLEWDKNDEQGGNFPCFSSYRGNSTGEDYGHNFVYQRKVMIFKGRRLFGRRF